MMALLLGVGSRLLPVGWVVWDKYAGDAAYAVMVFVLVAVPRGKRGVRGTAWLAFAICVAIEAFQATGLPLAWARTWPVVRYVLGTTFGWFDLVAYAAGIGAAFLAVRARTTPTAGHG